jgi:hypothetical protein
MRHLQTSQFPKHITTIYITNLPGEGGRDWGVLLGLGFQVSTDHKTQNTPTKMQNLHNMAT